MSRALREDMARLLRVHGVVDDEVVEAAVSAVASRARVRSDRVWRMEFAAPDEALTANDRHAYAVSAAGKVAAWRQTAGLCARQRRLPTGLGRVRMWIELSFPDRRRRDAANWQPTAKAIVDGLAAGKGKVRGYGLIADDDPEHLDGPHVSIGEPLQVSPALARMRARRPTVRVTILEVAPPPT